MCGIIGLLMKDPDLRPQLGALMVPMLIGMSERGPDSAGLAVFTQPLPPGHHKISVYSGLATEGAAYDWNHLADEMGQALHETVLAQATGNHAILRFQADVAQARAWLHAHAPALHLMSAGERIDLYKDVGTPAEVCARYDFARLQGSHLIGHTRMATESAVTPDRAHPFTAGRDFCLVHNGSLSNNYAVRRMLESEGIAFETDNDTEAACRFLEWRMREGNTLEEALQLSLEALDGFYTFLMGTADKMALIRDPFACKPALVAETDAWVAVASEFRALAHLPGIDQAHVFEPKPKEIYIWQA